MGQSKKKIFHISWGKGKKISQKKVKIYIARKERSPPRKQVSPGLLREKIHSSPKRKGEKGRKKGHLSYRWKPTCAGFTKRKHRRLNLFAEKEEKRRASGISSGKYFKQKRIPKGGKRGRGSISLTEGHSAMCKSGKRKKKRNSAQSIGRRKKKAASENKKRMARPTYGAKRKQGVLAVGRVVMMRQEEKKKGSKLSSLQRKEKGNHRKRKEDRQCGLRN